MKFSSFGANAPAGSMVVQAEAFDADRPGRIGHVDGARGIAIGLMIFAAFAALPFSATERLVFNRFGAIVEPFATPALFMIAGLLLNRAIRRPWPRFILSRVAPLVWRYVFWATIGGLAVAMLHAPLKLALLYRVLVEIIVTPPPMLVVLCALALSFFVARLGRGLPVIVMGPVAAALEIAHVKLGGPIPESFCRWFVYLYLGHAFAPEIRALARWIPRNRETAIASVVTFAMIDIFAAVPPIPWTGDLTLAQLPFASLGLGVAGALAVIVTARLVEEQPETRYLRWIGANALSVYLVAYVALVAFAACAPKAPDAFPPGLGLMLAGALVLCAALAVLRSGRVATRPEAHIDLGKAFARMASRFAPR